MGRGTLTAAELKERMAKELEPRTRCATCKTLTELAPDARKVVEAWFDDEDMPGAVIARAIGLDDSTVRRHRANCRG